MNRTLLNNVKTQRVVNATAAGTTAINGSAVDTLGFEAVRFTALFGTLTATQVTSIKAQYSDDGSTNWTDIAGSASAALADADSNKMLILDIFKPRQRYVRLVISRGTANAVVDGAVADLYISHRAPVTQGSTVSSSETLDNPAAGTA